MRYLVTSLATLAAAGILAGAGYFAAAEDSSGKATLPPAPQAADSPPAAASAASAASAKAPPGPAAGQPAPPAAPSPESGTAAEAPPARVGRLSHVEGTVAFHMAGETRWSAAGLNYPVATGTSFWTAPQARAQVRFGPNTIDIAHATEIDVLKLDTQVTHLKVPQGRIYLELRQLGEGQNVEIDVPRGTVWLLQPGRYDIAAGGESGPTRVAVYDGSARFLGKGVDIGIKPGDVAVATGWNPVAYTLDRVSPDDFIAWCRGHAYAETRIASRAYLSPWTTGYETLDRYGRWQTTAAYGAVWYPRAVPVGWVPYTVGRWIWVAPWGWTWVDAEPWGFAPFHYGRWALIGGAWGWVPGPVVRYPVYAPALVAFVGGPGFAVNVSFGARADVGWFPLAPGEVYWPSYTRNIAYIDAVNGAAFDPRIARAIAVTHGRPPGQITLARFANAHAATAVPGRVFAGADPVGRSAVRLSAATLHGAHASWHQPGVPNRAPVSGRARFGAAALGPHRSGHMPGAGPTARGAQRGPRFSGGPASQGGGPRLAGGRHGGGGPHFSGGRHGGGGPHFSGGRHGGGGPRFSGGRHGGGGPHFSGGRHGGGGPHFSGGRHGGGHGGGRQSGGPRFGGGPHGHHG